MPQLSHGQFPFGQQNTQRPMRLPTSTGAEALVVGVYPSAFHVAWTPPSHLTPSGPSTKQAGIGSFAVDVEPEVFWDGIDPDPADLLAEWIAAVNFTEGLHGSVAPGRQNGPSGTGLNDRILDPLGLTPDGVAFTDAVPWFFIKAGPGSQAQATSDRFAPIAAKLGVHPGSLPPRPTKRRLPELAVTEPRRSELRAEILEADAPVVITLGQETLDAVLGIVDTSGGTQLKLAPSGYGQVGEVTIDNRRYRLLPLAHPGFIRQTSDKDWARALGAWQAAPPRW